MGLLNIGFCLRSKSTYEVGSYVRISVVQQHVGKIRLRNGCFFPVAHGGTLSLCATTWTMDRTDHGVIDAT